MVDDFFINEYKNVWHTLPVITPNQYWYWICHYSCKTCWQPQEYRNYTFLHIQYFLFTYSCLQFLTSRAPDSRSKQITYTIYRTIVWRRQNYCFLSRVRPQQRLHLRLWKNFCAFRFYVFMVFKFTSFSSTKKTRPWIMNNIL